MRKIMLIGIVILLMILSGCRSSFEDCNADCYMIYRNCTNSDICKPPSEQGLFVDYSQEFKKFCFNACK